jgi:multicomponent Na+:H+ antiporter subunit E
MDRTPYRRPALVRFAFWLAAASAAWWAVAEGRAGGWGVALPTVLLAAALGAGLSPWPAGGVRLLALPRAAAWFAGQALLGGLDVARRALAPSLPLAPGLVELTTRLPEGGARVLLADALSLLPGTLTVELDGDRLVVHALDAGAGLEAELRRVEARVAGLLGLAPGGPG